MNNKYVPPSVAIGVRVSPEEYQLLEEKAEAAGLKPGRFAVAAALNLPVTVPVPSINRALYSQLAHTGNILNQIARALNSGEIVGGAHLAVAMRQLQEHLAETRRQLLGAK